MLLVGIGLVLVLGSVGERSPGLGVVGACVLGLGLCGGVVLAVRWSRAPLSEGGAVAGSTTDGLPMLSVVAPRAPLLVAVTAMVWVALCAAAGAVLAFADRNWLLGVILGVVAVGTAAYQVVPLARGLRSARVELTPEWLATEVHGARVQVPWTDISGAVPPLTRGRPVAVTLHGTTGPARVGGWPGWGRVADAPAGMVGISVEDLPVHPWTLSLVITRCAGDADVRAQVGSPASTDWSRWPPDPVEPRP